MILDIFPCFTSDVVEHQSEPPLTISTNKIILQMKDCSHICILFRSNFMGRYLRFRITKIFSSNKSLNFNSNYMVFILVFYSLLLCSLFYMNVFSLFLYLFLHHHYVHDDAHSSRAQQSRAEHTQSREIWVVGILYIYVSSIMTYFP